MDDYDELLRALPPAVPARAFACDLSPRESIIRNGYAFVPRVLNPDRVRRTRSALLRCAAQDGWLAEGTDPEDGIPGVLPPEGSPGYEATYRKILAVEAFHALGHAPALHGLMAEVLAEPVFCLPNKIARFYSAQPGATPPPPHQDWLLVQGSADTITAWVPLGDYTTEQAGLLVLARSHLKGIFGVDWMGGDGPQGMEWHGGDFRSGDVLLFHALTIHASNRHTGEGLRVSADYRYQPIGDPTAPAWLHSQHAPWQDLYVGWSRRDLQFYWKDLPLTFREFERDPASCRGKAISRLLSA